MAPQITLYFLQASRCIRTAWQLHALNLDYELKFSSRVNGLAPPEFRQEAGGLGKFPTLVDNGITLFESGNIADLLPPLGDPKRYAVLQWVHAAEGTIALHGIAVMYARWHQKSGSVEETEIGLSKNIQNDLNYVTAELEKSGGKFLFGDQLSLADIQVHFSVAFVLGMKLGTLGKRWERLEQYVKDCEDTESYKQAVEKTGHKLG
ncbi:hypothetical protein Q7P37_011211 [Cladosporium fusiforme]